MSRAPERTRVRAAAGLQGGSRRLRPRGGLVGALGIFEGEDL